MARTRHSYPYRLFGPAISQSILSIRSKARVVSLILLRHYSIEARPAGRETQSLRSLSSVDKVTFDLERVRKGLSALPVLAVEIVTADPSACVSTPRALEPPLRPIRFDVCGKLDDAMGAS